MLKKVLHKLGKAEFLIAAFLLIVLAVEIYATTLIPEGRKAIFSVLENKQINGFADAILFYASIYLVFAFAQGIKGFVSSALSIRVRKALTKVLQKTWVSRKDLTKHNHPSQRINEDARICTEYTLDIGLEIIISAFIVVVLVIQMYDSQSLLLYAAVAYTILSLFIAWIFNKPMKTKDIDLQVAEAAHREALHKIELQMGDYTSKEKFLVVAKEYMKYAKIKLTYSMFYKITMGFSGIVPFFILTPQYFSDKISLSQIVEGVTQFELVVVNLGILLTLYGPLVKAQAGWHRVIKFYKEA